MFERFCLKPARKMPSKLSLRKWQKLLLSCKKVHYGKAGKMDCNFLGFILKQAKDTIKEVVICRSIKHGVAMLRLNCNSKANVQSKTIKLHRDLAFQCFYVKM